VVPEPTTMIAGALLLLPFGASTLRILRKTRTA
jgi:F0F1-type ATP synthase assembly protein I